MEPFKISLNIKLVFIFLIFLYGCVFNKVHYSSITDQQLSIEISDTTTINYSYGDTINIPAQIKNVSDSSWRIPILGCFRLVEYQNEGWFYDRFTLLNSSLNRDTKYLIIKPGENKRIELSFANFERKVRKGKYKMKLICYCQFTEKENHYKILLKSKNHVSFKID